MLDLYITYTSLLVLFVSQIFNILWLKKMMFDKKELEQNYQDTLQTQYKAIQNLKQEVITLKNIKKKRA
jgi:hypothetical protein